MRVDAQQGRTDRFVVEVPPFLILVVADRQKDRRRIAEVGKILALCDVGSIGGRLSRHAVHVERVAKINLEVGFIDLDVPRGLPVGVGVAQLIEVRIGHDREGKIIAAGWVWKSYSSPTVH